MNTPAASLSPLALAALMLNKPSAVYAELRERPHFALPLIVVALAGALVVVWYYGVVDIEWLKAQLISGSPQLSKLPEADQARMMKAMTRPTMLTSGAAGALIGYPVAVAVQTLCYMLAGKITNVQYSFTHWFALTAWSGVGALIGMLASVALLLVSGTQIQIGPYALNLLSINELLVHLEPGEPGHSLLASIGLANLVSWSLTLIGVRVFSNRSWTFAAVFALWPHAVFYGVWAMIAFRG